MQGNFTTYTQQRVFCKTDGRTRRHVRACVDGGVFVWVSWEAFGFRFFACFRGNRMETQACGPGILWDGGMGVWKYHFLF